MKDLTGQKFGKLTVLRLDVENKSNKRKWFCKCECGNEKSIHQQSLSLGRTKSCGCLYPKAKDLLGLRFDRLLVIKKLPSRRSQTYWECLCDCGNKKEVRGGHLESGDVRSCGCINREREDLTGQKFGKLTIIDPSTDSDSGKGMWLCNCDCGKTTISVGPNLKNGHTKSCGCLTIGDTSKIWKGFGGISGHNWSHIVKIARERGICFELAIEQGWRLFEEQKGVCGLTGEELILKCDRINHSHGINTASLDRIDSSGSYTLDNVWWVHKDANLLKLDLTMEDLIKWSYLVQFKDNSNYEFVYTETRRNKNWTGHGLISGTFFSSIKKGAALRNLEFDITIEDIWQLFIKQNGRCKMSNVPIFLTPKIGQDRIFQTASLDRIDSSKGYTIDNVQWVHKQLNRMKWDFSQDRFFEILSKIYILHKDKYGIPTSNQENNK